MGVMNMGNIVPRVGFEPTTLACQVSVLPLPHADTVRSPLYPCLCSSFPERSVQITTLVPLVL